jgi:Fe-S-cluster containining protein
MKSSLIAAAEVDRLDTWQKYSAPMCGACISTCCTLPVEVKIKDLIRIGVVDEFEKGDPPKNVAKRLQKEGIVERFNQKSGIFTLTRMSNNDCLYLDKKSRLCTIYEKRPDTCRNHPKIGPRPGYCAYQPKPVVRQGCRLNPARRVDSACMPWLSSLRLEASRAPSSLAA